MTTQQNSADGSALAARAYPAAPIDPTRAQLAEQARRIWLVADEIITERERLSFGHTVVRWLLEELDPAFTVACFEVSPAEACVAFSEFPDAERAAALFGLTRQPDQTKGTGVWHSWTGLYCEHPVRFEACSLVEPTTAPIPRTQVVVIRADTRGATRAETSGTTYANAATGEPYDHTTSAAGGAR